MTLREYLEILNDCVINDEMDLSAIKTFGFVDIIPLTGDIKVFGHSGIEIEMIKNDTMVVKTTYYTEAGDLPRSIETSLNDPIAIHGINGASEMETIQETINALNEDLEYRKNNDSFGITPESIAAVERKKQNFEKYILDNTGVKAKK